MITTTRRARERILVYGGPSMGKSTALLQIAREVIDAGQTVYAVDNDNALERLLEEDFDDIPVVGFWEYGEWVEDATDEPGLVLFKAKTWEHDLEAVVPEIIAAGGHVQGVVGLPLAGEDRRRIR